MDHVGKPITAIGQPSACSPSIHQGAGDYQTRAPLKGNDVRYAVVIARATLPLLIMMACKSRAAELDYTLSGGIAHHSNINESATNPASTNVLLPAAAFDYRQQGSTLQINAAGRVEYRDYLSSRFGNQLFTEASGEANWTIAPQRLDFSVADYASVQPVSTLASNSPNNQQQTNVLSLGPTLRFRINPTWQGQAELRYINSQASKTDDFNASRGQAALRIFEDLSTTDQLAINLESKRVKYDRSSINADYTQNQAFVRYQRKAARFELGVNAGWTLLNAGETAGGNRSHSLLRVDLSWLPTERSTFGLAASQGYADAADALSQTSSLGSFGIDTTGANTPAGDSRSLSTGNDVIAAQVYLQRRVDASYVFTGERLSLALSPDYRRLTYINAPTLDQTVRGGSASLAYQLRETLSISLYGAQDRRTYDNPQRRDTDRSLGLNLVNQRTTHLSLRVSLSQLNRRSTAINQSYHDNVIYFGVDYRR